MHLFLQNILSDRQGQKPTTRRFPIPIPKRYFPNVKVIHGCFHKNEISGFCGKWLCRNSLYVVMIGNGTFCLKIFFHAKSIHTLWLDSDLDICDICKEMLMDEQNSFSISISFLLFWIQNENLTTLLIIFKIKSQCMSGWVCTKYMWFIHKICIINLKTIQTHKYWLCNFFFQQ